MSRNLSDYLPKLKFSNCLVAFFSSALQAFGIYNIHSVADVTEGGVFGMTLLLEHWFHISPSVSGFVLNILCYALGWKLLGKQFIGYSVIAACGFSICYRVCELFPPLWPQIANMPLTAALLGALFIGIGAGLCVRAGGATSGDDALAMSLSSLLHKNIEWIYLSSDLSVLLLSLSYIPFRRIAYSLLTVILSGQIIGWIQKIPSRKSKQKNGAA